MSAIKQKVLDAGMHGNINVRSENILVLDAQSKEPPVFLLDSGPAAAILDGTGSRMQRDEGFGISGFAA